MKLFESFENYCKAMAYDASLKNIERKIKELDSTEDENLIAGLKFARAIMRNQLRFLRYTKSNKSY